MMEQLWQIIPGEEQHIAACLDILRKEMAPYLQQSGKTLPDGFLDRAWGQGHPSVAVVDQQPIGYLLAQDEAGHSFLHSIQVARRYQRKGLGTQLMQHWEADTRQRGFAALRLGIHQGNPAQLWYERLGFRQVGLPYYQVMMEKSLD